MEHILVREDKICHNSTFSALGILWVYVQRQKQASEQFVCGLPLNAFPSPEKDTIASMLDCPYNVFPSP